MINTVYLHLVLSHIPVMGVFFGIMLLITAGVMKSNELKRFALGFFIFIAIASLAVYFTGESAEESVEHLPWVNESLIERHEQWASISVVSAGILGVLSAGGLLITRKSGNMPAWFLSGFMVLSIVAGGLIGRTANLGGKIRHAEIGPDSQVTAINDLKSNHRHHEDDD